MLRTRAERLLQQNRHTPDAFGTAAIPFSYRGYKRSAPGVDAMLPLALFPARSTRVTDERCFDAANPQRKDDPRGHPGCAKFNTALSRSGDALAGISALREIKFLLSISRLAAGDPIIHTSAAHVSIRWHRTEPTGHGLVDARYPPCASLLQNRPPRPPAISSGTRA